jgi:hypothetical protein
MGGLRLAAGILAGLVHKTILEPDCCFGGREFSAVALR